VVTVLTLASEATLADVKGLADRRAVEVVLVDPPRPPYAAVVDARVATRVAAFVESLLASGVLPVSVEGTADGLGVRLVADPEGETGLPDAKALPKGVTRDGDTLTFAASTPDDPYVVPAPDDFPDVLPGSSGPLAAAVQLFVGLPVSGYLSQADGRAIALVNEMLGLDYASAFTAETAAGLAAELRSKRTTPRRSK
jgi:hypothetical protein